MSTSFCLTPFNVSQHVSFSVFAQHADRLTISVHLWPCPLCPLWLVPLWAMSGLFGTIFSTAAVSSTVRCCPGARALYRPPPDRGRDVNTRESETQSGASGANVTIVTPSHMARGIWPGSTGAARGPRRLLLVLRLHDLRQYDDINGSCLKMPV